MIPRQSYTDAQRAFIQNTLDGQYDDTPGNNPATRRALRNAIRGLYEATRAGDGTLFEQHLATLTAASYRQLDCLTAEDFVAYHLIVSTAHAKITDIASRLGEIQVYTSALQLTRTIQSPELRQRYQLDTGQQRPLPL